MSAHRLPHLGTLGLATLLAAGCAGTPADKVAGPIPATCAAGTDLGVCVDSLRLTAANYLLDLRYRITDQERAKAFFSRKSDVFLIDPASGTRLAVPGTPKLGKLRQVAREGMTERSYFMLFANPGQFVKPGARLTLVVGDRRLENLQVEGAGGKHDSHPQL